MNLFAYLGTDEILKKDALEQDLKIWLGDLYKEPMAKEVYLGTEINADKISNSYQSQSFFSEKKALILKGFDQVSLSNQNEIAKIISQPNEDTGVFFVAEKLDGRAALKKSLKKTGVIKEFKLPYSNKIPGWIVQRAREKLGRQINQPTAQLLWEYIGDNTQELEQELQKLDNYVPKKEPITVKAIESLLSKHRQNTFFELQKNFGLRNRTLAYKSLKNLLEEGEQPIVISIKLFNHFLTLLKISDFVEKNISPQKIPGMLKIHDFIFQKEMYFEQARTRSQKAFKKIIANLADIEYKLKTGYYSYSFEIELEFAKLI